MKPTTSEIIGVFSAIVILAGVTVVMTSTQTPGVIGAIGKNFVAAIQAATGKAVTVK